MRIVIISLLLTVISIEGFGQASDFNNHKSIVLQSQFMGLIGAPRYSGVIGYKHNKWIYFAGYEHIKYNAWDTHRNGVKAGIQLYPYANLKQFKFYYQALVSYKWHQDKNDPVMQFLTFGAGFDFFMYKNLSFGFDYGIGIGRLRYDYYGSYVSQIDFNAAITVKYFLSL